MPIHNPSLLPVAALALTLAAPAQSAGAPEECRTIEDDSTRLACYDALFFPLVYDPPATEINDQQANEETSLTLLKRSTKRSFHYSLFDENFAIQPYRGNYLLPYTHSQRVNGAPFADLIEAFDADTDDVDNKEVKFQLSFKIPLAQNLLFKDATLWAGYTQLSLWQMYNSDASAPFRETNYEPEIFWRVPVNFELLGLSLDSVTAGFNHQSNGRSEDLSRSWNRLFAEFELSHKRWSFAQRLWYRLPEDEDEDDNPDIDRFLGHGDFTVNYQWRPSLSVSAQVRHNFRHDEAHTSVELGLVFPLPGPLNGYLEFVNGYGETLIDYNYRNKRVGIGVILNEWR